MSTLKAPNFRTGECCDLCFHMAWTESAKCLQHPDDEKIKEMFRQNEEKAVFNYQVCDSYTNGTKIQGDQDG